MKKVGVIRAGLNKEFSAFLMKVRSSTKQEREALYLKEATDLAIKLKNPNCDLLQRAIHCEMMGFHVDFLFHAISLLEAYQNLWEKRIAYLTVSMYLPPSSEYSLLVYNTVLKDLNSNNPLVICMALELIPRLLEPSNISMFSFDRFLSHESTLVRRKCILLFKRLIQISDFTLNKNIKKLLGDPDPNVMEATLFAFDQIAVKQPNDVYSLIPALLHILKQVQSGNLPLSFHYHNIPAPWIQMQIVQILGHLKDCKLEHKELICKSVSDVLSLIDPNQDDPAGYGIIYECIKTLSGFDIIDRDLLIHYLSRFLQSSSFSTVYFGLRCYCLFLNSTTKIDHSIFYTLLDGEATLGVKQQILLNVLPIICNTENVKTILKYFFKSFAWFRPIVSIQESLVLIAADLVSRTLLLKDQFQYFQLLYIESESECSSHLSKVIGPLFLSLPNKNEALECTLHTLEQLDPQTAKFNEYCWVVEIDLDDEYIWIDRAEPANYTKAASLFYG
jgi:hypothetical protein